MKRRTSCLAMLAILLLAWQMNESSALPPGLVSWWQAEDNANDSVDAHNGTLMNGATFAAGKVGQAFSFNGSNAFVQVPDSPAWAFGTNSFTIDLWVNFRVVKDGPIGSLPNVFIGSDLNSILGGGTQNKWVFFATGSALVFHINGPGVGSIFLSAPFSPIKPNQWYNVAVTRSGNIYTFYVDGASIGTATDNRAIPDANAPLLIAQAEGAGFFNGRLDEIQIYNRALSQNEIQSIINPEPHITSIFCDNNPNPCTSAPVGTLVTINGSDFGPFQGLGIGAPVGKVNFGAVEATVLDWATNGMSIIVEVPPPSGAHQIKVTTADGMPSDPVDFTVTEPPIIDDVDPPFGPVGTTVTINGENFGDGQGSTVAFGSTPVPSLSIVSWNPTQIGVQVPDLPGGSYNVTVTTSAGQSNPVAFEVTGCQSVSLIQSLADATVFLHSPCALALAQLSNRAYLAPGSEPGYTILPQYPRTGTDGLAMDAYSGPDGDIVIAFRGTASLMHLLYVDPCFAADSVSLTPICPKLKNYVLQGIAHIADIHLHNPIARIILTGHSLGGGVAEILGQASGFDTVVFNSPGVKYSVNALGLNATGGTSNLLNVILQGDLVHYLPLPVAQIGKQVTLQTDIPGSLFLLAVLPCWMLDPLWIIQGWVHYHNHSINTMVKQLTDQASVLMYAFADSTPTTAPGQSYTPQQLANSVVMPVNTTQSTVNGTTQTEKTFHISVTAGQPYPIDPPAAFAYIFKVGAGDPNFASVALPLLQLGQGPYKIELLQGETWQFLTFLEPLTAFVFPDSLGVDAFRVTGIPSNLQVTDPFIAELTFVSDGTFTGTITAVSSPPGDLNGNGQVDCSDLAIVKASFGKRLGQPGFDPRADTNNDNVVNVRDLAFVAQKLPAGTRCP